MRKIFILSILMFIILIQLSQSSSSLVLGDFNLPPRNEDYRVNNELLIRLLREASINTYAYLIWHNEEYDWEDFKIFLQLAQENNINTYAYLVPPSEHCEEVLPYRCDFVSWGQEIANLSLGYTVLKGFIIDDFLGSRNEYVLFTREYTNNFITASKEINPDIQFLPIIYYGEIIDYSRDYKDLTDGIVFPYLGIDPERNLINTNDEMYQIRRINEILRYNDKIMLFTYPWNQPSNEGDYVSLFKTIQVPENIENLDEILISFTVTDDFEVPLNEGYHYIQLLVDNEVVWEEDLAGSEYIQDINLNIKDYLIGKQQATISFRAIEKRGVYNFGVKISIINLEGIIDSYDLVEDSNSEWDAEILDLLEYDENHKIIVMVYASIMGALGDPSVEYIREATRIAIESSYENLSEGVILYSLAKRENDPDYILIGELYRFYMERNIVNPPTEDGLGSGSGSSGEGGSGGGRYSKGLNSKKSLDIIETTKTQEPLKYPNCKSNDDCNEEEICKSKRGNYYYKQCQPIKNEKNNSSWILYVINKFIKWFLIFLNNFNFQKT